MSRPKSASALAVFAVISAACAERNQGVPAADVGIYFPAAMTLDPRVPASEPSRWLFVANANSNLAYNAGSLVAVDLDKFFYAWMNCPRLCLEGVDDGTCSAADKQDACGIRASVRDVGEDLDDEVGDGKSPCRHLAFRPQVIECEDRAVLARATHGNVGGVVLDPGEEPVEILSVRMGHFITDLEGWVRDPAKGSAYLLSTVKADPSITWVELDGGVDDPFDPDDPGKASTLRLECGQTGTAKSYDSNLYDDGRCARSGERGHALRFPFDDSANPRIGPEPTNILVSQAKPWAYVTFATTPEVVLIDLARPDRGKTKPMIVDARNIFILGQSLGGGGWGLSERPCTPGSAEVPGVTTVPVEHGGEPVECARPLVYGGFRTSLAFARVLPDQVRPTPEQRCVDDRCEEGDAAAVSCKDSGELNQSECCIGVQCEEGDPGAVWCEGTEVLIARKCCTGYVFQEGDPGVVSCDPQLFFSGFTPAGGFDSGSGSGQLGDVAFSRDGRRLFAVQSNPGALLFIDTSVDERGEIRDEPAGLVELCNGPARMALFEDGSNEYAAVSCPTPSEVFVVDLSGFRVVANIAVGLGPHPIVVDRARRLLYVGNTLDKTISVIDISSERPTRFAEIARVGLQEPYKR